MSDLMGLAMLDTELAHAQLTKVYEWRHERSTSVSKALSGAGFAVALTPVVPILQPGGQPISWGWIIAIWLFAAVLIALGAVWFAQARLRHVEFISAQRLLGELIEMRPFLRLYRDAKTS